MQVTFLWTSTLDNRSNCSFCLPSVTSLLRKLKQQSRETLESRRPALIQALKELGDFYLELKWDFHSWGKCCEIPKLSNVRAFNLTI